MEQGKLVATIGRAKIYRRETFNHRTTPIIRWWVVFRTDGGRFEVARICDTKKQAMLFANLYSV